MSTYRQIEEAIIAWVAGVSGLTAILSYQNVPSPHPPFATVTLLGNKKLGSRHEMTTVDGADMQTQTITPRVEIHASVSVFGTVSVSDNITMTAFEVLQKLRDSAELDSQRSALAVVSLAIMHLGDVLNIPQLVGDSAWQSRATMDVIFNATLDPVVEDVPWVKRISGTGQGIPWDSGVVP